MTNGDITISDHAERSTPSVQVVVYTYNQAHYIAAALDSVLAQKTSFPFKILVHDDASTDGTREIIERYQRDHAGRIDAVFQAENQYRQGRRIVQIVWPKLSADYVAFLDGDDLWTDFGKLQAQYDFLNRNDECALCHTMIDYFDDARAVVFKRYPPIDRRRKRYGVEALANGNFVHTSAVMIRRSVLPNLPGDFGTIGYGDYALVSLAARGGWIGLIRKPMAMYRIHDSNLWVAADRRDREKKTEAVERYILKQLTSQQRSKWMRAKSFSASAFARRVQRIWRRIASFRFLKESA